MIPGLFRDLFDGVDVFTWTFFPNRHSFIFSQIVVNIEAFTSMITESDEVSDIHSSTGVLVVSLNRGDLMSIRTHPIERSHGNLFSGSICGNPSFSGWKS